jgi:hypothetical protein
MGGVAGDDDRRTSFWKTGKSVEVRCRLVGDDCLRESQDRTTQEIGVVSRRKHEVDAWYDRGELPFTDPPIDCRRRHALGDELVTPHIAPLFGGEPHHLCYEPHRARMPEADRGWNPWVSPGQLRALDRAQRGCEPWVRGFPAT